MKNLLFSFAFITISFIANCQDKPDVHAMLANYKSSDTILLDDFVKLSELSSNSKDYSIESFILDYVAHGFEVDFQSNSNIITEEMKNSLITLSGEIKQNPAEYEHNSYPFKIYFDSIYVTTPENKKVLISTVSYKLKMN